MRNFYSILVLMLLFSVEGIAQTLDLPTDTTLCYNEESPARFAAEDGWDVYLWTSASGTIMSNDSVLEVNTPGEYFLMVSDTVTSASALDSMIVDFNVVPVPTWNRDTTICPEETIELTIRNPSDYDQMNWYFPVITTDPPVEGAVFMASISDTGEYFLEVTRGSCTFGYLETLDTCERFMEDIPNVFTPNADGFNDMFLFTGMEVAEFDLLIFDRWGRQIFETHEIEQSWDGNVGGKAASEGVYYFTLRYRLRAKEEIVECTQSFTLMR